MQAPIQKMQMEGIDMNKVAIIGSGPSALFAAKTILENSKSVKVCIFERGKSPKNRHCNMQSSGCKMCEHCSVINGGGGAGLFSDGKLVLDLTAGGISAGISNLSLEQQNDITSEIKKTFEKFDGVSMFKDVPTLVEQEKYNIYFDQQNLKIKYYSVMHMGTSNLFKITCKFIEYLLEHFYNRIVFNFETEVTDIVKRDNGGYFLVTNHGNESFDTIVAAVGKSGASWLKTILQKYNCKCEEHNYFFGVRLETVASNIENLLKLSLDPKIYRIVNGRKIKVHCVCRNGDIILYNYNGIASVGGHSPYTENNMEFTQIDRANFNVLVSFDKEKVPPKKLLEQFKNIAGQKIFAQKLGDFFENRVTSEWGKLVPKNKEMIYTVNFRNIIDSIDSDFSNIFINFIESISKLSAGILDKDNIIYAPAIEWDMDTVLLNENMETSTKNIFAIGDGAGISQGIVYSSATGIIAGREIASRYSL